MYLKFLLQCINPFTPESDQCQNSPAASQEIWHHTVWRIWLFIAYSDERWLYYKFSLHHACNCFLKGWENTLFELRSERVKLVHVHLCTEQYLPQWVTFWLQDILYCSWFPSSQIVPHAFVIMTWCKLSLILVLANIFSACPWGQLLGLTGGFVRGIQGDGMVSSSLL